MEDFFLKLDYLLKYQHIPAKFQLVWKIIAEPNRKDINNREENYTNQWKHKEINISRDDLRTKYSRLDATVLDQLKEARIIYDNGKNKKKGRGQKRDK